jgi:hypothetical protein
LNGGSKVGVTEDFVFHASSVALRFHMARMAKPFFGLILECVNT